MNPGLRIWKPVLTCTPSESSSGEAAIGAAAALEILHPDAWILQPDGSSTNTAHAVGEAAAQTAGLPRELHLQVTQERFETSTLVGDLGLILKDSGGATIPGMLAFKDLLGIFQEPVSPFRSTTPPLGHIAAEVLLAMRALLQWKFDSDRVGQAIGDAIAKCRVDPEMGLIVLNTVARKAEEVHRGPVSTLLIKATEPARTRGLYVRAAKAYQGLTAGQSLAEVVRALDRERKQAVEKGSSTLVSKALGKEVKVEVTNVRSRGRKKEKWARFWVMDMDVDVKVTVNGETTMIPGVVHDAVPKATLGSDPKLRELMLPACLPVMELSLAAHTIINATVPAAVAAVLGKVTPAEAGKIAEEAAFITAGVPGIKARAEEVAARAILIAKAFEDG